MWKNRSLEVVAYTEAEGIAGAEIAAECGCDVLMGTCFSQSILTFCRSNDIKYMPLAGQITGRLSVLTGSIEGMVEEAKDYIAQGAFTIGSAFFDQCFGDGFCDQINTVCNYMRGR